MHLKSSLKKSLLCGALSIATLSPTSHAINHESLKTKTLKTQTVKNQFLIKYSEGYSVKSVQQSKIFTQSGISTLKNFKSVKGLQLVHIPSTQNISALTTQLKATQGIKYIEPNYIYQAQASTPNDPDFASLWGLNNTGQTGGTMDADINAPEAWEVTKGDRSVVIGIIDTGIDYTHPDLMENIWTNPAEIAGNGIDDDNNGYVDDIYGINAIQLSGDPMDTEAHGTHVAGTIGATGNNNIGVTGVNWQVQMAGCKFLGESGGTTAGALTCLDYFLSLKNAGVNIVATNNSWGGGGFSQALTDAIAAHEAANILFVTSAGNNTSNNDITDNYPSNYTNNNIITVAAIDHEGKLANFSNYGAQNVDVAAPGVNILSTVPGGGYASFNGTSMAAPHVTGLVALTKAALPSLNWQELKNHILVSGQPNPALAGRTATGRHIRAFDNNGLGSITCDTSIANINSPASPNVIAQVGGYIDFSVYHMGCFGPAGTLPVIQNDLTILTLTDDGIGADISANDGIYSDRWQAPYEGSFQFDLLDQTFNVHVMHPYPAPEISSGNYRTFTGKRLPLSDDSGIIIELPFEVTIGTSTLSSLVVGSNGCIGDMNSSGCNYSNKSLPSGSLNGFGSILAPLWYDWNPEAGGGIYWDIIGTAPNREVVIEWRAVPSYNSATVIGTFQAVLFEDSDDIEFNYQDTIPASITPTIGVQLSPSFATQYRSSIYNDLSLQWNGYDEGSSNKLVTLISTNATSYTPGDQHNVAISITNAGTDVLADLYISLVLPNTAVYYYAPGGLTTTPTPIKASWKIKDGYELVDKTIFNRALPSLTAGTYSWTISAITQGESPEAGNWISQDSATFEFTK